MIRTCFFDMGNVLVHFCHERMCRQMGALAGVSAAEVRSQLIESGLQWEFERGRVSPAEVHQDWQERFSRPVSLEELAHAASDIFSLNEPIVPLLDELRERGMRLVLLSNTSVWHLEFIRHKWDVLSRFDDFVTSCAAGAMKPEPGIFAMATSLAQAPPEECFYTDDIPEYVAAGRRLGWHAHVFEGVPGLRATLRQLGVPVSSGESATPT